MKKLILTLLMAISIIALTVGLVACNGAQTHTHTYASGNDWSHDLKGHYHRATCEHTDLRTDYEPHRFEMKSDGTQICIVCRYTEALTPDNCKHGYDNHVVSPTCTEQGYTEYVCRYCGDTERKNYTDAYGHKYNYSIDVEPTLDKAGSLLGVCTRDEKHTTSVVLPALNETDYTYRVTKKAECEIEGSEEYRYNNSTYGSIVIKKKLDALEHDYQSKICTLCGDHSDFTYEISYSACTITGFKGDPDETELIIPTEIKGALVRTIAVDAFKDMTNIVSVSGGDSLLNIESGAFAGCVNITTLDLPESLTHSSSKVATDAFADCNSLQTIDVPIGLLGYLSLKTVKSATLKDSSTTTLPDNAFADCTALEEIILPSNLRYINSHAFANCANLTSITLPEAVYSIGIDAFENCYRLVEVINLSNLELETGSDEHGGVARNAKLILGADDESALKETEDGFVYFSYNGKNYIIRYRETTSELTLPENLDGESYEIYNYAFYGRTDIFKLTVSEGVTKIGNNAFYGAKKLYEVFNYSQINIGKSTADGHVGYYAYTIKNFNITPDASTDTALTESGDYVFVLDNETYYLVAYKGTDTEITLPENLDGNAYAIGIRAFADRTDLTKITIPDTVTDIFRYAFEDCTAEIAFAETATITDIPDAAFANYAGKKVTLPNSVVTIHGDAFSNCKNLEDITLPAELKSIGNHAFIDCFSLRQIELPSTLDNLGIGAFRYSGLESIELNSGLTDIADYAFADCTALTSITIPAGIKNVGAKSFYNCTALENVYFTGDINDWLDIEFDYDTNSIDHYFRLYESYANPMRYASHIFFGGDWENEVTSIVFPEDRTLIDSFQFMGFTSLEEVIFPEHTQNSIFFNIGAFYGCTSLKSVALPDNADLSPLVFAGCTALESLTIPEVNTSYTTGGVYTKTYLPFGSLFGTEYVDGTVKTVQHYYTEVEGVKGELKEMAFYLPSSLTQVTLRRTYWITETKQIDAYTFENCASITDITLPESITHIGDYAFAGVGVISDNFEHMRLDSLTVIGDYAFKDSKIPSIDLFYIEELGEGAFDGCTSLETVIFNHGSKYVQLEEIKPYTFRNCTSTNLSIDMDKIGTPTLGVYAFQNCHFVELTVSTATHVELNKLSQSQYTATYETPFIGCIFDKLTAPISGGISEEVELSSGKIITVYSRTAARICTHATVTELILTPGPSDDYYGTQILNCEFSAHYGKFSATNFSATGSGNYNKNDTAKSYDDVRLDGVKILRISEGITAIHQLAFYKILRTYDSPASIYIPNTVTSINMNSFYCYNTNLRSVTMYYDGLAEEFPFTGYSLYNSQSGDLTVICNDGNKVIYVALMKI